METNNTIDAKKAAQAAAKKAAKVKAAAKKAAALVAKGTNTGVREALTASVSASIAEYNAGVKASGKARDFGLVMFGVCGVSYLLGQGELVKSYNQAADSRWNRWIAEASDDEDAARRGSLKRQTKARSIAYAAFEVLHPEGKFAEHATALKPQEKERLLKGIKSYLGKFKYEEIVPPVEGEGANPNKKTPQQFAIEHAETALKRFARLKEEDFNGVSGAWVDERIAAYATELALVAGVKHLRKVIADAELDAAKIEAATSDKTN